MNKYEFDESELLSLFSAEDEELRPWMNKPFLVDGCVCATDSHIYIRIKADALNGEYSQCERGRVNWPDVNCNYTVTAKAIDNVLCRLPQVPEFKTTGENIPCSECNGAGEVEWEYFSSCGNTFHEDFACPVCDGSGYESIVKQEPTGSTIPDPDELISIASTFLQSEYIQILRKAMEIIGISNVHLTYSDEKICAFKLDDNIDILIAGYLSSKANYRIRIGQNKK